MTLMESRTIQRLQKLTLDFIGTGTQKALEEARSAVVMDVGQVGRYLRAFLSNSYIIWYIQLQVVR